MNYKFLFFISIIFLLSCNSKHSELDSGLYAEIKSMFVDPNYRGKRIGDALLVHMLGTMADNSVPVVRLETGTLLKSALNLYRKHGFQYCDAFAHYTENNYSVFMEKKLII